MAMRVMQMSSQGDDDEPHDAAPLRGGAFTIAAHDGNGWTTPTSTSTAVADSSAEARAAAAGDSARGSRPAPLLRPIMRTLPKATLASAGGHGHYADRSVAQPDQPEELLQVRAAKLKAPSSKQL